MKRVFMILLTLVICSFELSVTADSIKAADSLSAESEFTLILPDTFPPALPRIYKKDGNYFVDFNKAQYIYENDIYIDRDNGNDRTGDGSKENPYRTIKKIYEAGIITENTNIRIKSLTPFMRDKNGNMEGFSSKPLPDFDLSFLNENENGAPIFITTAQEGLVWTPDDALWKTTRSIAGSVLIRDETDETFGWRNAKKAESLSDCRAEAGTYFIDGSVVYLNTFDGNIPTETDYLVLLDLSNSIVSNSGKRVLFSGFCWTNTPSQNCVAISADTAGASYPCSGHIVLDNCIAGDNDGNNIDGERRGNGFAIQGIKEAILMNCTAENCRRDGFNYHYKAGTSAPADSFILEYNCKAVNCGVKDTTVNNQGSTVHEGGNIVRVNTVCRNTHGSLIADVDNSKSFNIGCSLNNTADNLSNGGFVFASTENHNYIVDCLSNASISSPNNTVYISGYRGGVVGDTRTAQIEPTDILIKNAVSGDKIIIVNYNEGKLLNIQIEEYMGTDISVFRFPGFESMKVLLWNTPESLIPVSRAEVFE